MVVLLGWVVLLGEYFQNEFSIIALLPAFCAKSVVTGFLPGHSIKKYIFGPNTDSHLDSQTCVDDPRDTCDPQAGGADCIGVCVYLDGRSAATTTTAQFCGGIANIQCPKGKKCVDNPNDSCDPNKGGADCGGICV